MLMPGAGPGVVRRTLVEHHALCPYCHGSGIGSKPRGESYVCPWCGGTGERHEWRIQRRKEMMGNAD